MFKGKLNIATITDNRGEHSIFMNNIKYVGNLHGYKFEVDGKTFIFGSREEAEKTREDLISATGAHYYPNVFKYPQEEFYD